LCLIGFHLVFQEVKSFRGFLDLVGEAIGGSVAGMLKKPEKDWVIGRIGSLQGGDKFPGMHGVDTVIMFAGEH